MNSKNDKNNDNGLIMKSSVNDDDDGNNDQNSSSTNSSPAKLFASQFFDNAVSFLTGKNSTIDNDNDAIITSANIQLGDGDENNDAIGGGPEMTITNSTVLPSEVEKNSNIHIANAALVEGIVSPKNATTKNTPSMYSIHLFFRQFI